MWKHAPMCSHSGHSRTGHTGHMARLASKLARLANRLPGTNVPGWNFGWPTPKFPDARPTLLIFSSNFPRLIFPAVFTCVFIQARQRRSTRSVVALALSAGLRYLSRVARQLIWPLELGRA